LCESAVVFVVEEVEAGAGAGAFGCAVAPVGVLAVTLEVEEGDCTAPRLEVEYPTGIDFALALEKVGGGASGAIRETFFFLGFFPGSEEEGLRPK
jgi:hypothetical protein